MDWDKLRTFNAAVEAGSSTNPGYVLKLTQSSVSRQITTLEQGLKTSLFHRHARGLTPTRGPRSAPRLRPARFLGTTSPASGTSLLRNLAAAAFGAAVAFLLSLPAQARPEASAAPATAVVPHHDRAVVDGHRVQPTRREIPSETTDAAERKHCQDVEKLYRKLMDTHPQPIAGLCNWAGDLPRKAGTRIVRADSSHRPGRLP
jgi:hypothetical protein